MLAENSIPVGQLKVEVQWVPTSILSQGKWSENLELEKKKQQFAWDG